jgi:diaminopimelate decarboxylase
MRGGACDGNVRAGATRYLREVRPDLPALVAKVIERCERATLVFDLARIDANLMAIAAAARGAGIVPLFAAKSFPHAAVRALAAARLAGFDVGSPQEAAQAVDTGSAGVLSVADPTGRAVATAAHWRGRLIVVCETAAQAHAAPSHAEIAIRVSSSLTERDPAVGAVLEGTGRRRSRFGVDIDPERMRTAIAELARAAHPRAVGLHVHHGPVAATSSERFIATAQAVVAAAEAAGVAPRFVDLGGAWHAIPDLPGALREIRAALPRSLEILIEPGRRLADGAGFACGRVAVARELDERALRVIDLSRICHLRWCQPELVAPPPRNGAGRRTLFVGPTCYEDDVIGEWTVDPARYAAGTPAVLRNVPGYALAWNTGFGGIAPADVALVE